MCGGSYLFDAVIPRFFPRDAHSYRFVHLARAHDDADDLFVRWSLVPRRAFVLVQVEACAVLEVLWGNLLR